MPKKKTTKSPTPSRAREAAQKRETPSEITVSKLEFVSQIAVPGGQAVYTVGEKPRDAGPPAGPRLTLVSLCLDRSAVVDFFETEEGVAYVVTVKREKA